MDLADVPLVFAVAGMTLYIVLGGADYGAGIWQLAAGGGEEGARERDLAHHATAPVWEANHVWLIFILVVIWTAYPVAFGSAASTLCVILFVAAIGIIFRGAAYALRSGTTAPGEQRKVDTMTSAASIVAPFALGAAAGGIASRRVPVGNAKGDLITSWLNPTSIAIGVLAVAVSAYLAAVFLTADARIHDQDDLSERFRLRALATGAVTGVLAAGGLVVLHSDAHALYRGLVAGDGRPAIIVSAVAGVATFVLVAARRYTPARFTAAVAVGAVTAGWALAQSPILLPGLTIDEAASSHDTLVALVIAVIAGGAIIFPSLALLFRLVLAGRLGEGPDATEPESMGRQLLAASVPGLLGRLAAACALAGIGLLTIAETGWMHGIGIAALMAFIVLGFLAALPPEASPAISAGGPPPPDADASPAA